MATPYRNPSPSVRRASGQSSKQNRGQSINERGRVCKFIGVVPSHVGYQVVEVRAQKLETIQESYVVDLNGQKFLRVCRNDLNFCIWVMNVFDDEVRIVRSRIVHEERDERFIVPFSVLKL